MSEDCDQEELKTAYLILVKKFHPDNGGDIERFREVSIIEYRLRDIMEFKFYLDRRSVSNAYREKIARKMGRTR